MIREPEPGQRMLAWCLFMIAFAYSGVQFFSANVGPAETTTKTETVSVASNLTGETVVVQDSKHSPDYRHINVGYGMSTMQPIFQCYGQGCPQEIGRSQDDEE